MLVCGDCGGEIVYLTKPNAYRCQKCKRQGSGTFEQRSEIWRRAMEAKRDDTGIRGIAVLHWVELEPNKARV